MLTPDHVKSPQGVCFDVLPDPENFCKIACGSLPKARTVAPAVLLTSDQDRRIATTEFVDRNLHTELSPPAG